MAVRMADMDRISPSMRATSTSPWKTWAWRPIPEAYMARATCRKSRRRARVSPMASMRRSRAYRS